MALAIVMIYQAIDHLNFAQGEMAMFSTFIAWQLMQWGIPYWGAFLITMVISFIGGIAIERPAVPAPRKCPGADHIVGFIALFSIFNAAAGYLGLLHKVLSDPVRLVVFPRQRADLDHQAGMFFVTLICWAALSLLPVTPIGLAMRAAARMPDRPGSSASGAWTTALGWGMATAIGSVAGMLIAPVVFLSPI